MPADIFSLVKIGERSGMGLSQLYGNWEEAGYARPQLSESFNPERTKVEIEVEVAEKIAVKYTEKYTETRSGYTEKVTEKLSLDSSVECFTQRRREAENAEKIANL